MADELDLNSEDSKKKKPKIDPNNPEDAMNVAVSSLVSIAAHLGMIAESLGGDIQPMIHDIREYYKKDLLNREVIDSMDIHEIERDADDDE